MNLPDFLTEPDPGEIRLTGHRIGLYSVIKHYKVGRTAEEIVEEYPTLALDHVCKVIEFALANWEEVDEYVENYRRELLRQEALYGGRDLREKLLRRWAELYPDRQPPKFSH